MAMVLTKSSNVFEDYWLAALPKLNRDTEKETFSGHMGLLAPQR